MRKKKKVNPLRFIIVIAFIVISVLLYDRPSAIDKIQDKKVSLSAVNENKSNIYRVVKVVDGDTVKLETGETVRYIGIDTPETKVKKNGYFKKQAQPYGLEAADYNRKLVEGNYLRLEYDVQKKDKYGRILAYCYLGDTFVNARMIEAGYACVFTMPPNVKYADELMRLQRIARNQKRGLWGGLNVIGWQEALGCVNQIRTIRGKVEGIYCSKNMLYLRIGDREINGFAVGIYNKDLKWFSKRGIEPKSYYLKKTIEVTGRIRHNDTHVLIIVSGPEQIEF